MTVAIPGFSRANSAPKPRLIVNVEGLDKTGKSAFGFSAPGPVGYMNFDIGEEGVIQKFQHEKEIIVPNTPYSTRFDDGKQKAEAGKEWTRFHVDYLKLLKNCRTTVIDTGSEVWELLRLARLGKLTQVMPHHYVEVNQEFRDFVREAYEQSSNLVILSKLKAEWIGGKDGKGGSKTGKFERAGFTDLGYLVQVNMRFWREEIGDRGENDLGFRAQIVNCRQNPEIAGMVLEDSMITFPFLGGLVYPDLDADVWL